MATSYTACNQAPDWESPEKLKNERDTLRKIFETLKRKDATQVIQVAELEKQLSNALKEVEEARAAAQGMEANSQLQFNSLRHTIQTLHRRLGTSAASTQSLGVEDANIPLIHQSATSSEEWKLSLVEVEDGLAAIRTTLGRKDKAIETLHEENARLKQAKNDLRNACQNLKRKYSLCETSTDKDPGEVVKKMRFDSPLEHRSAQTIGHDEPNVTAPAETCGYKNYYNSCDSSTSNNTTMPTVAPDTKSSTDQPAPHDHQGCEKSDQHALAWLNQNIA